jgi:uncharacterized cupredoxin-like copper-binding protein
MGSVGGVAAMAVSGLVTAYLWDRVWRGRRRISCMTGMMVAMAAGMMVGLIAGVAAAGAMPGPLWPPTLAGMVAGILAGVMVGAPVSLMAVLDGGLAGLMGGTMGAMMGIMAPEAVLSICVFLLVAYLVATGLLVGLLRQELGDELQVLRPFEIGLLLLAVFVMGFVRPSERLGLVAAPEAAPQSALHANHGSAQADMDAAPVPAARVTTLEVMASDYAFDRKEVRISKGQPVRLVLRNSGSDEHDFVIQGLDANVTKPGVHGQGLHAHTLPGKTDAVEFIPLRSGNYLAICTIPGHKEAGMTVAINVVD